MDAALQVAVGPELQRVGDVDGDAARVRFHVLPGAVGHDDLEGGDGLAEEERQAAEVGVAAAVDVFVPGVYFGRAGAVVHIAEMAIGGSGVTMTVC